MHLQFMSGDPPRALSPEEVRQVYLSLLQRRVEALRAVAGKPTQGKVLPLRPHRETD